MINTFLAEGFISLGLGGLGNLAKLEPSLESFRQAWEAQHTHMSNSQNRVFYPMLYSFVHRTAEGHRVILPATWLSKSIHVGVVSGPYGYKRLRRYHEIRPVTWTHELPRSLFSAEALRGIQVNLAFFQVRSVQFLRELAEHVSD
jgi:hypothetical protein